MGYEQLYFDFYWSTQDRNIYSEESQREETDITTNFNRPEVTPTDIAALIISSEQD